MRRIGMKAAEVRGTIGGPRRIHSFRPRPDRSETWEYRRGVFIYFLDGVVTGVQRVDVR